jgi:hypothetical protein
MAPIEKAAHRANRAMKGEEIAHSDDCQQRSGFEND